MTINKRKKNSRQRGSWTHGWGAKKKHRGAGSRGGRGLAGSGKRGDAKKTLYWQDANYFGKRGFVSANKTEEKTINLSHLNTILDTLVQKRKAQFQNGIFIINLDELGYTKLLGAGNVTKKMQITVNNASRSVEEKVSKNGGSLTLLSKKEE
jgi:large subunit ribosomal protein L15